MYLMAGIICVDVLCLILEELPQVAGPVSVTLNSTAGLFLLYYYSKHT